MYDRQKVIDIAISQIGYHEKETNSQLDDFTANSGDKNYTKYARDLDALGNFYNGKKQSFAYCDVFNDWCFVTAYGRAAAQYLLCQPDRSAGAGCRFSAGYFRDKGQWHTSGPQKGDQIFFGSAWSNIWHTGLVVDVGNGTVTTVEGNSSDQVARRIYSQKDSTIFGYGRPNWGTQSDTSDSPQTPADEPKKVTYKVELPLLKKGDKNGYVKTAQTILIALGYDCGNKPLVGVEKADGDFGRATERATGFFQSKNKNPVTGEQLEVDGEIGGATWAALLKM